MWIVHVQDGLEEASAILPTAAADRESTEPLMVDFVEQWAARNNVDISKFMVHCCTGEDHGHDPLVVIKEHGDDGAVLLALQCTEIKHVIAAEKLSEHTSAIHVKDVGEYQFDEHAKTLH